jgi:hypothetical protein
MGCLCVTSPQQYDRLSNAGAVVNSTVVIEQWMGSTSDLAGSSVSSRICGFWCAGRESYSDSIVQDGDKEMECGDVEQQRYRGAASALTTWRCANKDVVGAIILWG